MVSFPSVFLPIAIKTLWFISFVADKTHEFVPTSKGIVSLSQIQQVTLAITAMSLSSCAAMDMVSFFMPHCAWFSFILFAITTLITNHYTLAMLLVFPPLLAKFKEAWYWFTEPAAIQQHDCRLSPDDRRTLGMAYMMAQDSVHRLDDVIGHDRDHYGPAGQQEERIHSEEARQRRR